MRRHSIALLLILLLLAAGGGMWWTEGWRRNEATQEQEPPAGLSQSAVAAKAVSSDDQDGHGAVVKKAVLPAPADTPDPGRYRRAYRLMLEDGKLTLEESTDVEGEFALPRAKPEEWAGMLRCRLLDAAGKVLAEEVMPAPDYLCTVLDSHRGEAQPIQLAVPGPAVFQVRLPRVAHAARLDVARITGAGSFKRDLPVGSIALNSP